MAAVGYPLWLWADGPTHVGPVSDSVAGLSVSLEARVTSLTFRMGDGSTVQCSGDGDEWTKAVEPGTKAPTCGYTYTEPSLPKDSYTVSAVTNWAVTWTANGQSGVINVPAVQTTELPVGRAPGAHPMTATNDTDLERHQRGPDASDRNRRIPCPKRPVRERNTR